MSQAFAYYRWLKKKDSSDKVYTMVECISVEDITISLPSFYCYNAKYLKHISVTTTKTHKVIWHSPHWSEILACILLLLDMHRVSWTYVDSQPQEGFFMYHK